MLQYAGAARFAYNWALEQQDKNHKEGGKFLSDCGSIKHNLKLTERTYICNECGLEIDRDLNASLNLCRYGTVSSTGINVCGVPHQTGVATAKQGTMKQKSNITLSN